MSEELRIIVVDQSGPAGGAGAVAPRGGQAPGAVGARAGVSARSRVGATAEFPALTTPRAQGAVSAAAGFGAVSAARGIAGKAAAGNVTGAAAGAAGVGATALGGPVGVAVAGVVAGFAVAAVAVRAFAKAIESQTDKLAVFSVPLSAAQAQTQIRREQALLRRAQRLGPELASAERLRSRFEDAISDLGTEILSVLLEMLDAMRPLIEVVIVGMKLFAEFLEKHGDTIVRAAWIVAQVLQPILFAVEQLIKLIERFMGEREDEEDRDPFTEAFMDLLPRGTRGRPLFWPAGQAVPEPGV